MIQYRLPVSKCTVFPFGKPLSSSSGTVPLHNRFLLSGGKKEKKNSKSPPSLIHSIYSNATPILLVTTSESLKRNRHSRQASNALSVEISLSQPLLIPGYELKAEQGKSGILVRSNQRQKKPIERCGERRERGTLILVRKPGDSGTSGKIWRSSLTLQSKERICLLKVISI